VIARLPAPARQVAGTITRAAFTTGLNRILLVAAIIAFVAGLVSLAAIRSRDFRLPGGALDADGEGSDRAANSDAAQRGRGERQGDDRAGLTAGLDPAAYWGHGPDHRDNPRGDSRHMVCRHGCGRDRGYAQGVCHHRADRDGRLRRRVARGQALWPRLARPAAATRCRPLGGGACRAADSGLVAGTVSGASHQRFWLLLAALRPAHPRHGVTPDECLRAGWRLPASLRPAPARRSAGRREP